MSETLTTPPADLIPPSVADSLPAMVRNELARLSAGKQSEFLEEYQRKQKSVGIGYLLWFLLGCHYAYVGKWGVQVVYWLTAGGAGIWAIVDLFRIPGLVSNYHKDLATDVLRNLKAIST